MSEANVVETDLVINGSPLHFAVDADETLLQTLRNRAGLTGTKEGCVEGECGACTVLVDGTPVDACLRLTASIDGAEVLTVEGLADGETLSPLQRAFVDHGAVQCGFCTPGFLMTLTALLRINPMPTATEVKTALAGNICRCTGYRQMLDAVLAVAEPEEST